MLGSISVLKEGGAVGEGDGIELWKCFKATREGFGLVGWGPCARTPAIACSSGTAAEAAKRSARVPILISGSGLLMAWILPSRSGLRNGFDEGRNLHHRLDGAEQPLELVPLIDQFNALLERIENAYSQMEGFNADVAHELCTPLATLIANNELALRRPEQEDMREVLASNLEELHRLTAIVNDMLFLSQADRGVGARRAPVVSLASMAADVLDYHEAALAERHGGCR